MLSGDKASVVKHVAAQLGIPNAYGDLLPEDKVNKVKEIKAGKESVAFVGDGVNDAPVVALSDVGIAMGGLGSDATIETADVVIQDDMPGKIPMAINIGKQTRKIVWQNITLALLLKQLFLFWEREVWQRCGKRFCRCRRCVTGYSECSANTANDLLD